MMKIKRTNNLIISLCFFILLFISLLFLVYSYYNSKAGSSRNINNIIESTKLIDSVLLEHYQDNKLVSEKVTLPYITDPKFTYFFSFQIPKSNDCQYLTVNCHYISFDLKYQDKLIYTNTDYKNKYLKSINKAFNLIAIPKEYLGKDLTLTFKSNLSDFRKLKVPVIRYGKKQAILLSFIKKEKITILVALFFIINSIMLLFSSLFFIKIKRSPINVILIAIFTFIMGIYSLLRTWTIYYFISNNALIHFIDYTCILTMSLPMYLLYINYFKEYQYINWRIKLLKFAALVSVLNLCIQYILLLSQISEFVYFQKFTFIWVPMSAFIIFATFISSDSNKIENKVYLVLAMVPMLIISSLSIILYASSYHISTSFLIVLSIAFFIFVNIILALKKANQEYNKIIENIFYEKLAYTCPLTNISNRNAFEEEKEYIKKHQNQFNNIALLMLDMNNLKEINDELGHSTGDIYLRHIGEILNMIKADFNNCKVFRYGGDEFIIVLYNATIKDITKIKNFIDAEQKLFDSEQDYPLSIAIGSSHQKISSEFNFENLLKIADTKMYQDKKQKKTILKEQKLYEA